ncbi:hypothetical protein ACI79G_23355 [Geodermatophilus sp. SYSU D00779]
MGAGAQLPGVSQFFASELAVVLNCGRRTAGNLCCLCRSHHRLQTHARG